MASAKFLCNRWRFKGRTLEETSFVDRLGYELLGHELLGHELLGHELLGHEHKQSPTSQRRHPGCWACPTRKPPPASPPPRHARSIAPTLRPSLPPAERSTRKCSLRTSDLAALSALYGANWDQVEDMLPFGFGLVAEAGELGAHLLSAIGAAEVGEERQDATFDWLSLRARAFRLLATQYNELRRGAMFIRRHHGDGNAFAPSLHSGARRRRRKPAETEEASVEQLFKQLRAHRRRRRSTE